MLPSLRCSISLLMLSSFLLSGIGCEPEMDSTSSQPQYLSGKLVVTGSSTVAPLLSEMARRFELENPQVRIDIQTGGSGKGINDVIQGTADIGMASRQLLPEEEAEGLVSNQIAADGVGIVLEEANPVTGLTRQQVIDIYQDRINNWKDVGGADQEIVVVHKSEGRATLEVFLEYMGIENPTIKPYTIVGENEQAIRIVTNTRGAIGYVSIGSVESVIHAGNPIKLIALDGVEASSTTVGDGTYKVMRPLILVTPESPNDLAEAFVQYCRSSKVSDLIRRQNFVRPVLVF